MRTPLLRRPARALAAALSVGLLASACSASGETGSSEASGDYPVTVENCGADVTFDAPPERVVMLKSASVPFLHDLGVMDKVVARAGQYPEEYYDQATLDELDQVPLLTDKLDPAGHLLISKEVVIAQRPDLVLGEVENLSRDTLAASDIPLIEEPALCDVAGAKPSFDDIYDQMELYGTVFDRTEEADAAVADLQQRVKEITSRVTHDGRTAAVLYPTIGGGTTYAYGSGSMANPQLEAAGFENVFADVDERVFEVTHEELLGRDPDVIIVLHSEGSPQEAVDAVSQLPGADRLTAVRNHALMPLLFNFSEPATPLSVDGLERIVDHFHTQGGAS